MSVQTRSKSAEREGFSAPLAHPSIAGANLTDANLTNANLEGVIGYKP
jgi:uncharacterized protein YjbI with pentapeptide repeats